MIFIDASTLAELGSYSGLLRSITRWLERDDLSGLAPSFVRLAEARFNRLIRTRLRDASLTVSAAGMATLPDDFDGLRNVFCPGTTFRTVPQVTLDEFHSRVREPSEPPVFAVTENLMMFDPGLDPNLPVILTYTAKIPPLSTDQPTNWLLAAHPDLYLRGALVEAEFYGWNDSRLELIKSSVDETIAEINAQATRQRFGTGPLVMRAPFYEGR